MDEQLLYMRHLDTDIKDALANYTGEAYMDLNKRLRNGQTPTERQLRMIALIDEAFENVPPIQSAITVYRGIDSAAFMPDLSSYVSTSTNEGIGYSNTNSYCCLLQILVPAGSRILPLVGISNYPEEEEVLLPRTGSFSITMMNNKVIPTVYSILYTPAHAVVITVDTKTKDVPLQVDEAEWVERLTSLAKLEMDEFDSDPQTAVEDVVRVSFQNAKLPRHIIQMAINALISDQRS